MKIYKAEWWICQIDFLKMLARKAWTKFNLEGFLIGFFQLAIVTTIIGIVAMVAADAWMKEDIARVDKLQKHFYDIAMSTDVSPPRAPTGVKPNYGEPSEPKVRVFQDASRKATTGMGYDARRAERGR